MRRLTRLLILAAAFMPTIAHAWQRTPPASTARLGELVRARTTNQGEFRGTLAFASRDSLVINGANGAHAALATSSIAQLQARRRIPVLRRIGRGVAIGAATGVLLPLAFTVGQPGQWGDFVEAAPILAYLFGILGGGIGAAVQSSHWVPVMFTPP